jgi:amino-acid N-acetyltransferase
LTETADKYFNKKGYRAIAREQVPEQIKASSEFNHVCPVSAVVMKKGINKEIKNKK